MTTSTPKILVVGTVSNASRKFASDFRILKKELENVAFVDYHFIESDSSDETVRVLEGLAAGRHNFTFSSLGKLRPQIPDRIERIRYCRNEYVHYIRENLPIQCWDYVIVADLDGMNKRITGKKVIKAIGKMAKRDAIFANQLFGYYDIFALRCGGWVTEDLIKAAVNNTNHQFSKPSFINYIKRQRFRQRIIYKQMKVIFPGQNVIEVESAFGGFGIYRAEIFLKYDYSLQGNEIPDGSEHITLHRKLKNAGLTLAIDPALINNWLNEYNINKIVIVRILKDLKRITSSQIRRGI